MWLDTLEGGESELWAHTGSHADVRLYLVVWLKLRVFTEHRKSLLAGYGVANLLRSGWFPLVTIVNLSPRKAATFLRYHPIWGEIDTSSKILRAPINTRTHCLPRTLS